MTRFATPFRTWAQTALQALGLLAVLLVCAPAAHSQTVIEKLVSPGALSTAHARFETNCKSCHAAFDKSSQNRMCNDCHKPVAADVAQHKGFHGKNPKVAGVECRTCHTEHKGRSAKIVVFDPKSFNHDQTEYPLRGAHLKVACASCHAPGVKFRSAPVACVSCHSKNDVHKGSLGPKCADCHTEANWKEVKFDHARTEFPLLGAHAKATCQSCHKSSDFKAAPVACNSCHAKDDAHKGGLGPLCGTCHTAIAWKPAHFDHGKTGFPLVGAHAKADCSDCHANGRYHDAKPGCGSCHTKDDVHKGKYGPNCAECHTSLNWKVSKFDHGRTGWALTGGHARLTCNACHAPSPSPARVKPPGTECLTCHAKDDKHKGLNGPKCESCHSTTSWKNATFDHGKTRFPLTGAHGKIECKACHVEPADKVKLDIGCNSCHKKDDKHEGQLGPACGTCHNTTVWGAPIRFDHDQTAFPLLGKHAAVKCADCHATQRFKDAKVTCVSCHAKVDPHKGAYRLTCEGCHNPANWKDVAFDHAKTRFPLDGKHAQVACAGCHKPGRGRVSSTCASCHSGDDVHNGAFGPGCEQCHSTLGWRGARVSP